MSSSDWRSKAGGGVSAAAAPSAAAAAIGGEGIAAAAAVGGGTAAVAAIGAGYGDAGRARGGISGTGAARDTSDPARPGYSERRTPTDIAALSDSDLQSELEEEFAERRRVDARIAALSGEVAERSRPELGAEALARRYGAAHPTGMIARIGMIGTAEARRLCRVGSATRARHSLVGDPLPPSYPSVAGALETGLLGVESAHHIVVQLDEARPRAGVDDFEAAEGELVAFAREAMADDVRRLAIRWRDALDEDGIEPREEALVRARSLKRLVLPTGMKRYLLDLDPLSAAYLDTAIDAEVGSALRSVRFIDAAAIDGGRTEGETNDPAGAVRPGEAVGSGESLATELGDDPRTITQMGADAMVDIVKHALGCASTTPALASATVVVRMTLDALSTGLGEAQIDGGEQPVSAGTARRLAAEGEIIPLVLGGDSEVLDLGRSRRVFTRAQRIAMAERDGGCAVPGCQRPPAHTEAHHIRWWLRDHGPTDLDNGVLLCTRDHHRVHAQGWEIRAEKGAVWFVPPASIDRHRRPRRGGRVPVPAPPSTRMRR